MSQRIRMGVRQDELRPMESFEQFAARVVGQVDDAKARGCQLLVWPEYFSASLMSLEDTSLPERVLIRALAQRTPRVIELMRDLASSRGLWIVAGTLPVAGESGDAVFNDSVLLGPDGEEGVQGKLHLTRWEIENWSMSPRQRLRVFETALGRIAINVCYDVEFPELARAAARAGCQLLIVPSCTEDRAGFVRVRHCAAARAIENQMIVAQAVTVGGLVGVESVATNEGAAAILTPSDAGFPTDGVLAEGPMNESALVIGDVDLSAIEANRVSGAVRPLRDSEQSTALTAACEVVSL